jgi:hypothetical protein
MRGEEADRMATTSRRLFGAWALSCWAQVLLPGQFWPHYYLLVAPGAAIAVSLWVVDSLRAARRGRIAQAMIALLLIAALGWSLHIQARDYLGRTPDEITSEYKGGKQWVALRKLGGEIAERSRVWHHPRLFVWGWQSPLYIYSGLDGVSRHFFANELLKVHADDDHPLVRRWTGEIMRDLHAHPPELIFAGHPPFPALRQFLQARYLPSPPGAAAADGRGLWVETGHYGEYHATPTAAIRP